MKKQLQGISLIFSLSGIAGCVMTFLPDKKNQKDS